MWRLVEILADRFHAMGAKSSRTTVVVFALCGICCVRRDTQLYSASQNKSCSSWAQYTHALRIREVDPKDYLWMLVFAAASTLFLQI